MATVLAATVVAPNGAPCRVLNIVNIVREPATIYPKNIRKNKKLHNIRTVFLG